MSAQSGLEMVYTHHHTKGARRGRTMFGEIRGNFLRKNIGTNKKVLDIGCRDGELTREYAESNDVLGVDIDMQALATLKETLPAVETQQVDLHANWDLPKGTYDVVVAGEVLEHLYYPSVIVGKAKEVLSSEGMFIGSVPNGFSLINRLRLLVGKKKGTTLHDPTHINHFKRSELEAVLNDHFTHVTIEPLGKYAWLDALFPGMFAFMFLFEAHD